MNNRRNFIKKAGTGIIGAGLVGSFTHGAEAFNQAQIHKNDSSTIESVSFEVQKPLFCPYHSILAGHANGGGSHYYRDEPFTHNPFTIMASGMSGSPVIMDSNGKFIGFTTNFGYHESTFSFDGVKTLTVTVPNGQELFIDKSGDADTAWKQYNKLMMRRLGIKPMDSYPKFWNDVEYCTWVEQKYQRTPKIIHFDMLTHEFVEKYINKLIEFDYPKGKLTLDHGWGQFPDGTVDSGFGSWVPDSKKFPDFKRTMALIQEKGFTPGLWIGFPKIHKNSLKAKESSNMLGNWSVDSNQRRKSNVRYLNPLADIYDYASETIGRFYEMGIKKFKIDMSYNTKSDMLPIHKELYRASKNIDKDIEMEFHVPDIFFTKYTDVIRTNDVWLRDDYDWKGRVNTHYKVSYKSAPTRGINLDHIGGNDTNTVNEAKFLEHLAMYKGKTGYPLVSLLPHHISKKCVDDTGTYLWEYVKSDKKFVSDFFEKE